MVYDNVTDIKVPHEERNKPFKKGFPLLRGPAKQK